MSLSKYAGPWTNVQSSHLLRRTTFGPDKNIIETGTDLGLEGLVEKLLEVQPLPEPPVNFNSESDPETPIGESWVNMPYTVGSSIGRRVSLYGWTIEQMKTNRMNVIEKLVVFWHNHFAVADGNPDARVNYSYINKIRRNALTDFRQMTKDITIDTFMLRYLNGNENVKESPNENYARELLELFTVGKGDNAGPGDYTTFTETDVIEIAKVLTGWRDRGYKSQVLAEVGSIFRNARHDTSTKTLSHRFNNTQIVNNGADEYADLIDVIFESTHVAKFVCRKIYRWFVYYEITDEIEQSIIEPLANIYRDNDYNLIPVLRTLFSSEHFYNEDQYGCMIKSPLDFVMSLTNSFGTSQPTGLLQKYTSNFVLFDYVSDNQMAIYNLPSVAGWKPYYQSPGYYQIWINSVTLPSRKKASDALALYRNISIPQLDFALPIGIDTLAQLDNISDPYDINKVIRETTDLHLPKPLGESQYDILKSTILNGLPDFEWSVEYGEYVADPEDEAKRLSIENKLKSFLVTMMRMPEFQLM